MDPEVHRLILLYPVGVGTEVKGMENKEIEMIVEDQVIRRKHPFPVSPNP